MAGAVEWFGLFSRLAVNLLTRWARVLAERSNVAYTYSRRRCHDRKRPAPRLRARHRPSHHDPHHSRRTPPTGLFQLPSHPQRQRSLPRGAPNSFPPIAAASPARQPRPPPAARGRVGPLTPQIASRGPRPLTAHAPAPEERQTGCGLRRGVSSRIGTGDSAQGLTRAKDASKSLMPLGKISEPIDGGYEEGCSRIQQRQSKRALRRAVSGLLSQDTARCALADRAQVQITQERLRWWCNDRLGWRCPQAKAPMRSIGTDRSNTKAQPQPRPGWHHRCAKQHRVSQKRLEGGGVSRGLQGGAGCSGRSAHLWLNISHRVQHRVVIRREPGHVHCLSAGQDGHREASGQGAAIRAARQPCGRQPARSRCRRHLSLAADISTTGHTRVSAVESR